MNSDAEIVEVIYAGPASYSDLAPMLDALQAHFPRVETRVGNPEGSARGGAFGITLDMVFKGAEFVATAAAAGLIGGLATSGFERLRRSVLVFLARHREQSIYPDSGPVFAITVNYFWMVYPDSIHDDDFVASLLAAKTLVDSLPESPVGHYEWDSARRSWTGPINP
jgi:hypothetical protein